MSSIVFVTISMTGGGTERVIAILANYWYKQGKKITILMIGGNDIAYELEPGISAICVSEATAGSLSGRIKRINALRRAFRDNRDATIIAMGTVASMFASLASLGLKNKVILSERNDPNRLNHRPIRWYERCVRNLLYLCSDRIVFQTKLAMESFPHCIKRKSLIIMNPIIDELPAPKEYNTKYKKVITAGRLTKQKNHKMLIEVFAEFHVSHEDYILEIFGEGECRKELEQKIKELGADNYISLRGFSSDIYREMNVSKIYVSASDWEGLSNSLMEAMAMGMAVIATDCPVGGNAMLIEDNVNGILVKTGDKTELLNAMKLLTDEEQAKKLARRALEVRYVYNIANIAKKWEAII